MKDYFLIAWRSMRFMSSLALKLLLLCFLYISIMFYHDHLSNFIGQHFFYPKTRILIFPNLILEAYVIEAVVCLPLVFPLVWVYEGLAIPVALLLSKPVIERAYYDFRFATVFSTRTINEPGLISYHAICHFFFLVIGAMAMRNQLKWRKQFRFIPRVAS